MRWLAALILAVIVGRAGGDERPNIVVFVSDDHRADVLGCAGHAVVQTPNLDRLAACGTRYTNAFVTTSICAASRATILTGLAERTHRYTFGTPPLHEDLVAESYPALLRQAGYRTGFVGKLGVRIAGGPDSMFDDVVVTGRRRGERHFTDHIGDRAVEFIESCDDGTPFCLSVSFHAAHAEDGDKANHYPHPPAEDGLYDDIEMPRPTLDDQAVFDALPEFLRDSMHRDRYFWRWDTPEKYDRNMRNYLRMLTGLDRNIGRVIDALRAKGFDDDTVVIFIGDNGYYMGERGFAGKWSHFEESLRVPLIVFDPRVDDSGSTNDAIALNTDVAPTVLARAGIEPPARCQGVDLASLESRDGFFCEHRLDNSRIPRWEGFRGERYVYARYMDQDPPFEFLHDLETDPQQLVNLASDREHRDALRTMRRRTNEERDRIERQAPLPRVLILGDSISMGYHRFVVEALRSEAVVIRPGENCAGTIHGIRKIDAWLALHGGGWDVIHFNFGLHDLKRVKEDGSNSTDPSDGRQSELDEYEVQLRAILAKLLETDATVIFATTTPVPAGGVRPHRDVDDPARYNDVARAVMRERDVPVNDLNAKVTPFAAEYLPRVDVHFTRAGSKFLGDRVTEVVREALAARN